MTLFADHPGLAVLLSRNKADFIDKQIILEDVAAALYGVLYENRNAEMLNGFLTFEQRARRHATELAFEAAFLNAVEAHNTAFNVPSASFAGDDLAYIMVYVQRMKQLAERINHHRRLLSPFLEVPELESAEARQEARAVDEILADEARLDALI